MQTPSGGGSSGSSSFLLPTFAQSETPLQSSGLNRQSAAATRRSIFCPSASKNGWSPLTSMYAMSPTLHMSAGWREHASVWSDRKGCAEGVRWRGGAGRRMDEVSKTRRVPPAHLDGQRGGSSMWARARCKQARNIWMHLCTLVVVPRRACAQPPEHTQIHGRAKMRKHVEGSSRRLARTSARNHSRSGTQAILHDVSRYLRLSEASVPIQKHFGAQPQ